MSYEILQLQKFVFREKITWETPELLKFKKY